MAECASYGVGGGCTSRSKEKKAVNGETAKLEDSSALFPEACILPTGRHTIAFETGSNSGRGAAYSGSFTYTFEAGQSYSLVCEAAGFPIFFIKGAKETTFQPVSLNESLILF